MMKQTMKVIGYLSANITVGQLILTFCTVAFLLGDSVKCGITKNVNHLGVVNEKPENNRSFTLADQSGTKPIIIGVLTQVLRDYKRFTDHRSLHLPSSYVKWIESSGAQVIPILLNEDETYYEQMFNLTNGLLFIGGDNLLNPHKNTPMMVAAKKLYKLAVQANNRGEYYPIWGTCLGFELLSVLSSGVNALVECSAVDITLRTRFNGDERGKMFAKETNSPGGIVNMKNLDYSKAVLNTLEEKNLTYHYHHKCLTYDSLRRANLLNYYRPLAYSKDVEGLEFVSIFEAIRYPFYGVQFHPEKLPFEFVIKKSQKNIPHTSEAIAVSRYFGDFFIAEANQNKKFKTDDQATSRYMATTEERAPESLASLFIYSHNPTYTGLKLDLYEQRYLFPYQSTNFTSDEEFLDYIPGSDEEAPEDLRYKN